MNQVPQQSPGPMTPPSDSTGLPPTQPPHMPQPQPRAHSVCGILGVVFGAIGFVLSFIPIINNAAIFFDGVGVVLAIIAIVGTFRGKKSGKAVAIIGAVLSILAIVITLNMQASFSKAFNEAGLSTSSSSSNASSDTTNTPTVMDQEGDLKDLHVRIDSAVKSVNDYEDKPTVLVTYQWKNTSDKNTSFMVAATAKVFQNGQQLDRAIYGMNAPEGYDANSEMSDLQPGASGTVTIGYVLKDDSPVTVEVTDLLSLHDDQKVSHTFNLTA